MEDKKMRKLHQMLMIAAILVLAPLTASAWHGNYQRSPNPYYYDFYHGGYSCDQGYYPYYGGLYDQGYIPSYPMQVSDGNVNFYYFGGF